MMNGFLNQPFGFLFFAFILLGCNASFPDKEGTENRQASNIEQEWCPVQDMGESDVLPGEPIKYQRVLRRIALGLKGRPPTDAERLLLESVDSDEGKNTAIENAIDEALGSKEFYEELVDFGHDWMWVGRYRTASYRLGDSLQSSIRECGSNTLHAGAYHNIDPNGRTFDGKRFGFPCSQCLDGETCSQNGFCRGNIRVCDDPRRKTRTLNPWWSPNTAITLVGDAAAPPPPGGILTGENGQRRDCRTGSWVYRYYSKPHDCGCGPDARWCSPIFDRQRYDVYEEPARFFAHLGWYDRPLSDLVLGNYTVATRGLRAVYKNYSGQISPDGDPLENDTTWILGEGPTDPLHQPGDMDAWQETVVQKISPVFASLDPSNSPSGDIARNFVWDPRQESGTLPSLPSAGVLTMLGPNQSFPRERFRAARFLEIFACQQFAPPPAGRQYPPLGDDISKTGDCLHCHALMDPAAIAFKRMALINELPYIMDLGYAKIPQTLEEDSKNFRTIWKKSNAPRILQQYLPNTTISPISENEKSRNLGSLYYDTIPKDVDVLGAYNSDSTMGPLGFGKVLIRSGAFDRCVARKVYKRFMGRELDPATESGYIRHLGEVFKEKDRKLRPLIKYIYRQPEFKRGIK